MRRGARTRTRRRALTGAATLGVAAVVVGGSIALVGQPLNKGRAIQPGDGGSTSAAPATPSDGPSSATPTDASPRPSSTWQWCTSADVTLTLSDSGAAAGTAYSVILIKAKPTLVCKVEGFADVRAERAVGDPIGPAAESGEASGDYPVTGSTVTSFLVGIANSDNYDAAVCLPVRATSLLVTLPHDSTGVSVGLPEGTRVCSGNVSRFGNQLTVGPIVTGPDGQ